MEINTRSVHFVADKKLLDFIEKKLNRVEKYYKRIIDASVVLSLENSGQIKDKIVDLSIRVPGRTIVSKGESKTFEKAFDIALKISKRQIKRHKERLQSKY